MRRKYPLVEDERIDRTLNIAFGFLFLLDVVLLVLVFLGWI